MVVWEKVEDQDVSLAAARTGGLRELSLRGGGRTDWVAVDGRELAVWKEAERNRLSYAEGRE